VCFYFACLPGIPTTFRLILSFFDGVIFSHLNFTRPLQWSFSILTSHTTIFCTRTLTQALPPSYAIHSLVAFRCSRRSHTHSNHLHQSSLNPPILHHPHPLPRLEPPSDIQGQQRRPQRRESNRLSHKIIRPMTKAPVPLPVHRNGRDHHYGHGRDTGGGMGTNAGEDGDTVGVGELNVWWEGEGGREGGRKGERVSGCEDKGSQGMGGR